MTVAQLNVEIGATVKGFDKAIREVETSLKRSMSNLSSLSQQMSTFVTLPVLAFGAATIKAAGEFESLQKALETTMVGAGYSIENAQTELVALNKAALAPGLDFKQAVQGSVRLQSVGFSAEKARGILAELANGIAATGGAAPQLDAVTRQFQQMIGKGRILQSDLSVILENMPGLAAVMKNEFGASTADALREAGVTAEQFITRLTENMSHLPRVTGGIANSITNAGVAIQQSLAQVGLSLNETFDITGKIDSFAKFIQGAGSVFSSMGEGSKRMAIGIALAAASFGPLLKVAQGGVWVFGKMYVGILEINKASTLLQGGGLPMLIKKWEGLNAVMKANVIGVTIAALAALVIAIKVMGSEMSVAAQIQKGLDDVNKTAAVNILEQESKVNSLVSAYKSEGLILGARKNILDELKKISPEYFGQIREGQGDIEAITKATAAYSAELLKTAKITAAKEKIVELQKALYDVKNEAGPDTGQSIENALLSSVAGPLAGKFLLDKLQSKTTDSNIEKKTQAIKGLIDELNGVVTADAVATVNNNILSESNKKAGISISSLKDKVKELQDSFEQATVGSKEYFSLKKELRVAEDALANATDKKTKSEKSAASATKESTRAAKDAKKTNEEYEKSLWDIVDAGLAMNEQAKGAETAYLRDVVLPKNDLPMDGGGLATDTTNLGTSIANLGTNLTPLLTTTQAIEKGMANMEEAMASAKKASEDFMANIPNLSQIAAGAISQMGDSIASSLSSANSSWADFAKSALNAIADVIGALIKLAVANAVASAIKAGSKINPLVGLALAGAAGALASAIFKKAVNSAKFAKGGIVHGPVNALVGEYPGARSNPEVIAPLSKLKGMLNSGGDMNLSGVFRIQGPDLVLVLEKAQQRNARTRGY